MRCSGWGRSGADIGRRTVMAGLGLVALVDISGAAFRRGQEVQRVAADVALVVAPALLVANVRGLQDQLPAGLPGGIGQIVVFDHQGRSIAKLPRSGVSAPLMELGVAQAPIGERAHPGGRVVVVPAWMDIFGRGGLWLLGLSVAYLAASRRLRPLGGVAGSEGAASLEPVPLPVVPAQAPESAGGADRIGMSDGPPAVAASSLPSADVAVEGDGTWPGEPQGAPAATGVGGRESLGPVAASPACSSLLLGIAEETRSALGVVSSMVELLHDSVLEDRQRRYLGQLEWAAGNLDRLAAEVANLAGGGSDLEAPQSIEFSPEALSEAAVLQAHRRGAEASREWAIQVDPALPRRVEGDAARIQAALAKVVEHALRTYPRGDACLRVRLASDRPGAVICWHVHIRPRSALAGGDEPGLRGGVGWQIAEVLVRQAQGVWEEAPLGADEVGVGFCVPVSLVLPAQPPPPVSPAQVAIVTGH
ncbi:MAG: HAMP domain-containing histidine kinase, partial [Zoogloeaceae bacterium]|nr:HAMP domain-containing histidine kinase [Zoogloeaceae bacterium]